MRYLRKNMVTNAKTAILPWNCVIDWSAPGWKCGWITVCARHALRKWRLLSELSEHKQGGGIDASLRGLMDRDDAS